MQPPYEWMRLCYCVFSNTLVAWSAKSDLGRLIFSIVALRDIQIFPCLGNLSDSSAWRVEDRVRVNQTGSSAENTTTWSIFVWLSFLLLVFGFLGTDPLVKTPGIVLAEVIFLAHESCELPPCITASFREYNLLYQQNITTQCGIEKYHWIQSGFVPFARGS